MNRKTILLAFMVLGLVALAGCGSSGPSIVVQITNAPATLSEGQIVSLSASVSNDTGAGNVNWSCAPSGSCGTFNPTTTSNGGTTSYTAPNAAGSVTITAADADHTGSTGTAVISVVSATNSTLTGNYVFFVEGTDSTGIYVATGTIVADGNGNITSGEEDYVDAGGTNSGAVTVSGTYTVGSNGAGSVTLNVLDSSTIPNNGVETFSFASTSSTHALIIQFDGTATSSGTLDFQATSATTASSLVGSYAFAASGEDLDNEVGYAVGGVANFDASSGNITSGSIYVNDGGTTQSSSFNGPVTGPDQFGRGTIKTNFGLSFVYYAVQGEVMRIVETDIPDFASGGSFYGQGTAGANSSFSNTSLKGTYVFFDSGETSLGPLGLAGQFTADGSGDLTAGVADTNDNGTHEEGSIAGTAVYTISGNGSGTLTLPGTPSTTEDVSALLIFATDPNLNLYDPNSTTAGTGGGALLLDNDSNAIGTGLIVPQTTGSFQGNYAVNLRLFSSSAEVDIVGQTNASGTSITGTADLNLSGGTPAPGNTFTGTYNADGTNVGRYTGKFTVGADNYNITYYQVTASEVFILDTDSADVGNGFMETQ